MIAAAAVQEDVDAVGISILSGAHLTLFPAILEQLRQRHLRHPGRRIELAKAKLDEELAQSELKRQQSLKQGALASQKQLEDARKAAQSAETALALAEAERVSLDLLDLEIEAKRQDVVLQESALELDRHESRRRTAPSRWARRPQNQRRPV